MDCANCESCQFDSNSVPPSDVHEIHVTFQTDNSRITQLCEEHNIKLILIEYDKYSNQAQDLMTSVAFKGTNGQCLIRLKEIQDTLESFDVTIIRNKIETSPTNPIISQVSGYFESHLATKTRKDQDELLTSLADQYDLHKSRNAFKINDDEIRTIMLTYRSYDDTDIEAFKAAMHFRKHCLEINEIPVEKLIIEYCWYDDNIIHDKGWIN